MVRLLYNGPQEHRWEVIANQTFTMEVLIYDFPGWVAEVDDERVPITPSDPHGLITFSVSAGRSEVYLYMGHNQARAAGGVVTGVALMLLVFAASFPARAGTLQRVADGGTFTIGYRADARPFSFADANGLPAGYAVALCDRIAVAVGAAAGRPGLEPDYELVTAATRFAALEDGTIDLLCGAATVTLARRERVDFSLLIFATGAVSMAADGLDPGAHLGLLTAFTILSLTLAPIGIAAALRMNLE
jgi:hypothetical protein